MSAVSDLRTRVVDGPHVWGRYSVRPVDRTMWSTRTLVVYPPGTTRRERAVLRAWSAWPAVGALLAIAVMAALAPRAALGTVAAVGVYAGGFLVLGRAARRLRPGVRTLIVTTFHGTGRPEVHGDVRLLGASLDALTVPERALRAGAIRPVDFESIWADVWDDLPSGPRSRVSRAGTPRAAGPRGPVG
ncbi:hypothetical protein BIV03_00295 [Curtobacterium sp. MCBA15_016]|uniref:DUF6611 family protein n=1 Tax=Curtobacterium sp. MCBA15_016 TaxID=1898740 RepID=UPI0008DD413D|nr:DUF6611 family protein [Curtobacterium sp. MCBA15_016]OII28743.1 hypothetical protein BIV03_00295 [Curtobacterium sp. MCBA15_016]